MSELNAELARRAIVEHTRRLAESAAAAGPDAAVPTSPEWTVTELVEHVGQTQHWVAEIVERRITDPMKLPTEMAVLPGDPGQWRGWLSEAAERVAGAFSDDALDAPVFNAAGDGRTGARFWLASVLNETVVHGFDAANAAVAASAANAAVAGGVGGAAVAAGVGDAAVAAGVGDAAVGGGVGGAAVAGGVGSAAERVVDVDAEVAAALVSNHFAMLTSPTWEMLRSESAHAIRGSGQTLQWLATDGGGAWFVERRPDGATWRTGTGRADVTVSGSAGWLLLVLTRRLPLTGPGATGVSVDGDVDLAQHWLDNTAHVAD
ncbi:maleylpyruvate isomerase N-terminal domain-containing protein [Actinoplanes sp. NPDC051861]|uniref:maleylpyruvate isomerase N-terminal domain-containing protein n=1 Tax=Actinoplanes sp. NPDC051861 TaxID=3155170 RepID=UPI0034481E2E